MSLPKIVQLEKFRFWPVLNGLGSGCTIVALAAGIEDVSPHPFRHTVATRLVRDPEVDLVTAATFLCHSRLETTARYSRPGEEDLAVAAERLG